MLENVVLTKDVAEDVRGLVDDGGEGNRIDDPAEAVASRMIQRKGERGQSLPAAGRYGEGKQSRHGLCRTRSDGTENFSAQAVDLGVGLLRQRRHVAVESGNEIRQNLRQGQPDTVNRPALDAIVERLGVLVVGIDEAGKNHPAEKSHRKGGGLFRDGEFRRETRRVRRDLLFPDGINLLAFEIFQPVGKRSRDGDLVRQARMVTGDGIGDQLGDDLVVVAARQPRDVIGAGCRMIDRHSRSRESVLKLRCVFAEVV
jgi:hypothetical protein